MSNEILLDMQGICKQFAGVKVLQDMSLTVKKGTVHVLMGENGAGKSTLMKILMGYQPMDAGHITFCDKPLDTSSIQAVLGQGISMIYQELNSLDNMTVGENIFCGKEPTAISKHLVDHKRMYSETQALLDQLQITSIKPRDKVSQLAVAQKQLIEIAKAVSYHSRLIIMDEPTSAITEAECHHLFSVIRKLKQQGVSFIYITHKMSEIAEIGDEITVMRDGRYIGTRPAEDFSTDELIAMMVGRKIEDIYPKRKVPVGSEIKLQVEELYSGKDVHSVSFHVKRGEILGVAGLMGAGRTEIMETIFGCRKKLSGTIKIDGKLIKIKCPKDAIRNKIAFLTEDRKKNGCYLFLSVYMNTMMVSWLTRGPVIREQANKARCLQAIKDFGVKTTGLSQTMNNLSGGNQQKVLLSRWLITEPDILILDEPTRGVDVGAKSEIYQEIMHLAEQGKSIIMISSELPEILGISDRVMVVHNGQISGVFDRNDVDQEKILAYAAGLKEQQGKGCSR